MSMTKQEVNWITLDEIRERVFEDGGFCQNCEHCELTKDGYGTGDSPTLRECTVDSPDNCIGVQEHYG